MNDQIARLIPCTKCGSINRIPLPTSDAQHATCGKCHAAIEIKKFVFELDSEKLKKVILNSPIPVVVDFWAPWCGPCKMFAPTFENYASNNQTGAIYIKFNTEDHGDADMGIRSIPTLMIFEKEKEKARQSGALNNTQLKAWLNQHGVESK